MSNNHKNYFGFDTYRNAQLGLVKAGFVQEIEEPLAGSVKVAQRAEWL